MTMPAQKIQMPVMGESVRREKAFLMCDKAEETYLLRNGTADTRVFTLLVSRKRFSQHRLRTVSLADVMEACDLGPSAAKKALANHIKAGCCKREDDGRYSYVKVTGPRLATPPALEKRGRWDREAKARDRVNRQEEGQERGHTSGQERGHNYGRLEPKTFDWDGFLPTPKEYRRNVYINTTTTDTDTRAEESRAEHQVADAFAEAVAADAAVVVVGLASQNGEQHPPVGGAADAAVTDLAVPVRDFHDQDPEIQEKPATNNENVPPAAASPAPRTLPAAPAASAAHPVPASLNRRLWTDWVTAFAAVEAAGLSGIWERWQAHVGGSASQQLTHAEQWAEWVSAGLADALRLQVPETIGDTEVRSPARHLAGAMSNRAEEARRNPAPAAGQAAVAPATNLADYAEGDRIRFAGREMTVVEVIGKGLVTDDAEYGLIPLRQVGHAVRIAGGSL